MSQNRYPRKNWAARGDKVGVYFIELREILDVVEQKSNWVEQEEQINKHAELSIKLRQAVTRNRQERELSDHMLQQEQELKILIKEKIAENNNLVNHMRELNQEVAKLNKARQREHDKEDKPSKVCSELKNAVMNQSIHLSQIKENIKELQEQKRHLTIQRNRLVALKKKTQESISTHTAAEVTLKVKQVELKRAIREKDKQIQQSCLFLKTAMSKICDCGISNELTLDWNKLFDELRKRQGRVMDMLKICKENKILTKAVPQSLESAPGPVKEKYKQMKNLETKRFIHLCAEYILKVTGTITLCGLCMMMLMPNLVVLCSSPDYDLWTVLFDLAGEFDLALPSVF